MDLVKPPQKRPKPKLESIKEEIAKQIQGIDVEALPSKYEILGDIIILKHTPLITEQNEENKLIIAKSYIKHLSSKNKMCKAILMDQSGIKGELRQPTTQILYNEKQDTETIHVENNIKYCLDPCKVMFASGNGTERMRFSKIDASEEVVVDMFAGIGYFSIPLAKFGRVKKIYSLEKNPDSHLFLCKNVKLNKVENVVEPILGDNRESANHLNKKANRVIMGYIPTPVEFIKKAIEFLELEKDKKYIIHYHHIAKKSEYETLWKQHFDDTIKQDELLSNLISFHLKEFVVVKSYAPQLFHCVADVEIFVK